METKHTINPDDFNDEISRLVLAKCPYKALYLCFTARSGPYLEVSANDESFKIFGKNCFLDAVACYNEL